MLYYYIVLYMSSCQTAETGKIRNKVNDLKKVIRNFQRENGNFFLKNGQSRIWSAKMLFRPPQTRRQVAVYGEASLFRGLFLWIIG